MALTLLLVAYSLAAVGPDAAGGAEQIVSLLDRALARAGHRVIVVALHGSVTAGHLIATPSTPGVFDPQRRLHAQREHARAIAAALDAWPIDLVHMHGVDFDRYLPTRAVPVLATLHLPAQWYSFDALHPARPATWLNGVSMAQHRSLPADPHVLEPVPNGVALGAPVSPRAEHGGYALFIGRICPEKGVHLAIDAARLAGVPIVVAGPVFPYPQHRAYFDAEVRPRLGTRARYVGSVGRSAKAALLAGARCLLVPSLAPETSSLVAMEAIASGVPVVAFRAGALPEVVDDGETGLLVGDVEEMAAAIARANRIAPDRCRRLAAGRFAARRMVEGYLSLYRKVLAWHTPLASTSRS